LFGFLVLQMTMRLLSAQEEKGRNNALDPLGFSLQWVTACEPTRSTTSGNFLTLFLSF